MSGARTVFFMKFGTSGAWWFSWARVFHDSMGSLDQL